MCPANVSWRYIVTSPVECQLHYVDVIMSADCVSNHQPHDCLLNHLFGRKSKKTSKLRVTGLCVGNSLGPVNSPHKWPVTRKMFPFDDAIMDYLNLCWLIVIGPSVINFSNILIKILKNHIYIPFTRTPVRVSKINAVAHVQLTFQMLTSKIYQSPGATFTYMV